MVWKRALRCDADLSPAMPLSCLVAYGVQHSSLVCLNVSCSLFTQTPPSLSPKLTKKGILLIRHKGALQE